ncbi:MULTISPECIES: group II intron maturase-specific domain-containing protein [Burkholderiaceae]|uniref:group II intron maturase-specific domain-containing protein n=1 Tax=Paraburkholderia TaxID=1822464 RepID=UPI00190D56B2|nr:hypothetical protein [Paraburkholderia aspalathi]MBK5183270.1 hypothetical protein [Burkholderia sp. R-69749]
MRKLRDITKGDATVGQDRIICLLGSIISGWANYYRHEQDTHLYADGERVPNDADVLISEVHSRCGRRHGLRQGTKRYFYPASGICVNGQNSSGV